MELKRSKLHLFVWAFLLLLLFGGTIWQVSTREQKEPPASVAEIRAEQGIPVTVEEVCSGPWEHWITLYGRVKAPQPVDVSADRQEYVQQVLVDVGDRVNRGQRLALLEKSTLQQEYNAQKARVNERAGRYRRLKTLQEAGGASAQEVEAALAEAEEARARLEALARDLDKISIGSPVNGIILQKNIEEGALASPGSPLFVVADLDRLEAELDVAPDDAWKIRKGLAARVKTPNGWVDAEFLRIDPSANPGTGLFQVVLAIPPRSGLSPGQTLEGQVQDEKLADAISISYESIQQLEEGKTAVYVVSDDVAKQRMVMTGRESNGRVRVLSGLEPCDVVVVRGADRLFPDAKIWIQED
jgi:RND family efflux transporter MFP subunit